MAWMPLGWVASIVLLGQTILLPLVTNATSVATPTANIAFILGTRRGTEQLPGLVVSRVGRVVIAAKDIQTTGGMIPGPRRPITTTIPRLVGLRVSMPSNR
jgi:hypothetical protein